MSGLRITFIAICLALFSAFVWAQPPAVGKIIDYNVSAQPLGDALNRFAEQSGLRIVFYAQAARGRISPPMSGAYTPEAALRILLAGSSLQYRFVDATTVEIHSVETAAAVPHTQSLMQLAQTSSSGQGSEQAELAQASSPTKTDSNAAEIIVTGSYIRGSTPAGSALKVYSRQDIERSGVATLEQFGRQMPENFASTDIISGRSSNVGYATFSTVNGNNVYQGAAFNLRGLGAAATLTLLNGQRLAPAGLDGSFADISQIPLSAIERIEVLTDGASAIYGADAVAGVVNIITRTDFDGATTSLRYAGATEGGAIQRSISQLLGRSWDGGNVTLGYEHDQQEGLRASQRDYIPDLGGLFFLLPENRRNSFTLSARQQLGANTVILSDALYSKRNFNSATASSGLFYSQAVVNSGSAEQWRVALSLDHEWSQRWSSQVAVLAAKSDQMGRDAISTVQGGSTDLTLVNFAADPKIMSGDFRVRGELSSRAKVALGIGARSEDFESNTVSASSFGDAIGGTPALERDVASIYAEIFVPWIKPADAKAWAQRLEFSAAVRYDNYSDFGSTVNPKLGLSWEPTPGIMVKSSYGTSFRAPLLDYLGKPPSYITLPTADGGLDTATLYLYGGNPAVSAEEAESFTAGIVFEPIDGAAVELSYFRTTFDDRVSTPPTNSGFISLTDPLLAPFITRNPPLALVQSYFDHPGFVGDYAGAGAAGVLAIYDSRLANMATTRTEGLSFNWRHHLQIAAGELDLSFAAERLLSNEFRAVEAAELFSLLNGYAQPPKWKGRAQLNWSQGAVNATLAANYVNSYDNSLFSPSTPIDSWFAVDLGLSYTFDDTAHLSLLRDVALALNVSNAMDEEPPVALVPPDLLPAGAVVVPYDAANASPVGRLISLSLTKRW